MSLTVQGVIFGVMFATGVLVGAWADLLKVVTAQKRKSIVVLADMIFWLSVTPLIILLMFRLNYLELRLYTLVSALLGVWVYSVLLSRHACGFFRWMLQMLSKGLELLFHLLQPLLLLFRLFAGAVDILSLIILVGTASLNAKLRECLFFKKEIPPSM